MSFVVVLHVAQLSLENLSPQLLNGSPVAVPLLLVLGIEIEIDLLQLLDLEKYYAASSADFPRKYSVAQAL